MIGYGVEPTGLISKLYMRGVRSDTILDLFDSLLSSSQITGILYF